MADARTPRTKFIIGFLVGFIVGLFGYMTYTAYASINFSIPVAALVSIGPGVIVGLLMRLDKSKTTDPTKTSFIADNFDTGKNFRLGRAKVSLTSLAITSAILGVISLFVFSVVFGPLAFVSGIDAVVRELRGKRRIGIVMLSLVGIGTSSLSTIWYFLNL